MLEAKVEVASKRQAGVVFCVFPISSVKRALLTHETSPWSPCLCRHRALKTVQGFDHTLLISLLSQCPHFQAEGSSLQVYSSFRGITDVFSPDCTSYPPQESVPRIVGHHNRTCCSAISNFFICVCVLHCLVKQIITFPKILDTCSYINTS